MNKRLFRCLFLAVAFLMTVSCVLTGGNRGDVVYQAVDEDGKPAPEIVVLEPGGKELRRIELPDEIGMLIPFRSLLSRHVLYEDAMATQKWFLVDTASGKVQAFDSLGLAQDRARPCASFADQVLLCGKEGVYLLDVRAGEVQQVPVEINPQSPVPPLVEQVSADQAHFLVRTTGSLWLVPVGALESTRRLGLAQGAGSAAFSDDGKSIVYTARTGQGETQVILEPIDGSSSEIVLSGPDIVRAAFVPEHDQLVVVHRERISLYALDDKKETDLLKTNDVVRELRPAPDGKHAVFGVGGLRTPAVAWTVVDLDTGSHETLAELGGYRNVYGQGSSRWLFLADDPLQKDDVRIASLDLNTAETRVLLSIQGVRRLDLIGLSTDGYVGLLVAIPAQGEMQIWLLVADRDGAVLLSESRTLSGSLSPDGKWVALSEKAASNEQAPTIKLVATGSGEEQVIGEGLMPVWTKP
jgi:WD40 repeat protein